MSGTSELWRKCSKFKKPCSQLWTLYIYIYIYIFVGASGIPTCHDHSGMRKYSWKIKHRRAAYPNSHILSPKSNRKLIKFVFAGDCTSYTLIAFAEIRLEKVNSLSHKIWFFTCSPFGYRENNIENNIRGFYCFLTPENKP